MLLVDADLRKPRVHKVFAIPSAPGLTEYLTSQVDASPIRTTVVDNLCVISSGDAAAESGGVVGVEGDGSVF